MAMMKKGEIVAKTTAEPVDIDWLFERPGDSAREKPVTNALVMGEQATWKTSSLATIPRTILDPKTGEQKEAKVLHIDADGRSMVIDRKANPHFTFFRNQFDPANAVDVLKRLYSLIDRLNAGEYDFNVGIFDTITPLDMLLWTASKEDAPIGVGHDRLRKVKGGVEEFTVSDYETDYTLGADKNYEFVKQNMTRIIFSFMHRFDYFFCIAHSQAPFFGDKGDGEKFIWTAKVRGSMKSDLPKLFQEVYFTRRYVDAATRKKQWGWLCQPIENRDTGSYYPRTCFPFPQIIPQDYSIITNNNWHKYAEHPVSAQQEEET